MGDLSEEKTRPGRLVAAPFMTAILRSSLGTASRLAFLRSRAPDPAKHIRHTTER